MRTADIGFSGGGRWRCRIGVYRLPYTGGLVTGNRQRTVGLFAPVVTAVHYHVPVQSALMLDEAVGR
jgi:hypothetical protein